MATWSELVDEFNGRPPEEREEWIATATHQAVAQIAAVSNRNVIAYTSAFLQKPQIPGLSTAINREDINGFMAGVHGLDPQKSLLLLLHTPGGLPEAAQTIVSYLRSKYANVHAVIPTYAMSAGTMVALGCDRIIMGRQSQLGPTDPQLIVGQRPFSAHSIVSQFDQAKNQIIQNPVTAHAWAPVLRTFGPALLEEARKSLEYTRSLVENWLEQYMFRARHDSAALAMRVAAHFGGPAHGSHGRRIGREEARQQDLDVVDLEDNQDLQEAVLTLYHLATIAFEQGPALKTVVSSNGRMWVKNLPSAGPQPR